MRFGAPDIQFATVESDGAQRASLGIPEVQDNHVGAQGGSFGSPVVQEMAVGAPEIQVPTVASDGAQRAVSTTQRSRMPKSCNM
jgi:hypothetical protein